jgi:hypothetical protein
MRRGVLAIAVLLLCAASAASAQRSTASRTYDTSPEHRVEIIPMGGYAWTMSMDVYGYTTVAEIDLEDAAFWGVALDVNLARPYEKKAQLRLLYRREDSDVQFRSVGLNFSDEASIEYWQIGGLGGIQRGKAMPFTAITLGGTRLVAEGEDEWKFSMIFGLGVKVYTSPKVGLMIQGNWPITFTDTWGGVTVGTGGAGVALGGTGISQIDVGGGLIICF